MKPLPLLLVCGALLGPAFSPNSARAAQSAQQSAAAPAAASALVRVELSLVAHEGESPSVPGWSRRCPNCGNFHGNDAGEVIGQQRPLAWGGMLLSPDTVLVGDPAVAPRFLKGLAVAARGADARVGARISAYSLRGDAVLLRLDGPLAGASPLPPFPRDGEPLAALSQSEEDSFRGLVQVPLTGAWRLDEVVGLRHDCPANSLVLGKGGRVLGLTLDEGLAGDGSWRRRPESWQWLSAEDYAKMLAKVRAQASAGVLRAHLRLRAKARDKRQEEYMPGEENEPTRSAQLALVLSPTRVLVLTDLAPSQTARLEHVVLGDEATGLKARFLASSAEYGFFVVEPETPLPGALSLNTADWPSLMNQLLPAVELRLQKSGEEDHYSHLRIGALNRGHRDSLVPELPSFKESLLVFDREAALVALPVTRRKNGKRERWESPSPFPLHASALAAYRGDLGALADARNVPLSEELERRKAWLGVELQQLSEELARIHGTMESFARGDQGALVTAVSPGSPAARMGLQPGDVLLRLKPEGEALPQRLELQGSALGGRMFPWDRYDEVPEEYYDQIPVPWGGEDAGLATQLKELGFGTRCEVEYSREGKPGKASFEIEVAPPDYETAPLLELKDLGLALKELTHETRKYLQLAADAPGLIVADIEAGSTASVSGLKPFELLTTANERPLRSLKDFEDALAGGGQLSLSVRRMHQSRVVNLQLKK